MKIFTIVCRNIQILLNSKLSSMIFILGPLVMILLVGSLLGDTSLKNVKAGLYFLENNSYTDMFIYKLKEAGFDTHISSSLKECEEEVIEGISQACIEFKNINQTTTEKKDFGEEYYDINMYVDFSKQRTVWNIIGSVQWIVEKESNQIRSIKIDYFKKEIDKVIKSLSEQESKIDNVISNINSINSEIDSSIETIRLIKSEFNSVKSNLQNASVNLNEISANLNNIAKILTITLEPTGIPGVRELKNSINTVSLKISEAKYSLNKANSLVLNIDDMMNNQDIESKLLNLKSYSDNIKNEFLSLKREIYETKSNLNYLKDADFDRILNPIVVKYQSASENEEVESSIENKLEDIDYIFPSFAIFFIMFASLVLSTTLIIKERVSNAYIRNIASKTSGFVFTLGNFITCFLVILIQAIVIFSIAYFFVNIDILSNVSAIIIVCIISIILFSTIGLILGYLFNSQETAIISSISLGLLFLVSSSIIAPVELLPELIAKIVSNTPLAMLEEKLRSCLIFNIPIEFSIIQVLSLITIFIFSCLMLFVLVIRSKEKEISA